MVESKEHSHSIESWMAYKGLGVGNFIEMPGLMKAQVQRLGFPETFQDCGEQTCKTSTRYYSKKNE